MYLVFIIFLYEITQMFLKSAPKKNYMLRQNRARESMPSFSSSSDQKISIKLSSNNHFMQLFFTILK